jgi:hypothetical protein
MKTIIFIPQTLTFNSCRTITPLTASKSQIVYYDTDGIYGNTYSRNIETNTQNNQNQYKEYFGSLRDDNQTLKSLRILTITMTII